MACKMLRASYVMGVLRCFFEVEVGGSSVHQPILSWHHGGMTYCLFDTAFPRGDDSWHFPSLVYSSIVACHPASLAAPSTFFKGAIKIHIRISWMHLFSICSLVQPFCGQLVGVYSSRGRPPAGSEARAWKGRGAPGTTGAQLVPHGGAPLRVSTFYDDAKRLRNI